MVGGEMEHDVVIVGAGAAGVGLGIVLQTAGIDDFVILERDDVGSSFMRWPAEMRFISPSFPSNGFGQLDLNAVAIQTSPGWSLSKEHPSGREYALYLRALAEYFELPVETDTDVHRVVPATSSPGFEVHTSSGMYRALHIVWAAGEFQYPNRHPFPGAEHAVHNVEVGSWADLDGDEFVVIGGYESGIDAAIHLSRLGSSVSVLDVAAPWDVTSSNPSVALSPYTVQRFRHEYAKGGITLVGGALVQEIRRERRDFTVRVRDGRNWTTPSPPILATGFTGSLHLVRDLFEWSEDGHALLTEEDESTRWPGLFVVGPGVRHEHLNFCFIYKFRQRFAVVAAAITRSLGIDPDILELYRQHGMFLDDLSCCDDSCLC